MSAAAEQANFPTMIIPRGTEIRVNSQGQLSIKTPDRKSTRLNSSHT